MSPHGRPKGERDHLLNTPAIPEARMNQAWAMRIGVPAPRSNHVLIGGHYFDVVDTQVRLVPVAGGTDMQVQTRYRISTHFNVYAGRWARALLGNFSEQMLQMYKARSEGRVPE